MKAILQIILLFNVIMLFSCKRNIEPVKELAIDTAAIAVDSISPIVNNKWRYHHSIDKMTSKSSKFADIISNESLHLEFPYDGVNYGQLTLRNKNGLNIYLSIQKGQISGGYDITLSKFVLTKKSQLNLATVNLRTEVVK